MSGPCFDPEYDAANVNDGEEYTDGNKSTDRLGESRFTINCREHRKASDRVSENKPEERLLSMCGRACGDLN